MDKIVVATWSTWMALSALTMGVGLGVDRDRVINVGYGGLIAGVVALILSVIVNVWAWAL